ncbi:alpha/beta fold hydrolase [Collimonas pratensis]|uniref:Alpha/beta hydrolase fold family protein n=1 Tax=Collimonas pratensis TaxID=279113 RepID=A0ABM5Z154_9BURK|nr:alpha/beta hydrolase [Collimonas pratensis]AMP12770.1 alpha/beta hydrolase fold family protein [Collimonas pratensis]
MTAISVADTTVHYSVCGKGTGLVLVHGTSIDAQANFGHVAERFADQRQVISPNYAGCGNSTIPAGDLTLDVLVEQIAATIRHASDSPVDLLGDSLGAVVAAATAARYPALVRKLVLVAGWADSSDARHQMVFQTWAKLEELDSELSNRYVMSLAVSPPFLTALGHDNISMFLKQAAPPDTKRRIELGLRIDIRDLLKKITAPTLVVRGAHDYLIPEYQTRALHESIQGSEYAQVESGHAAFLEKPDVLVQMIRDFLFNQGASTLTAAAAAK